MNKAELSRLLQRDPVEWVRKRHGDPRYVRALKRTVSRHLVPLTRGGYRYVPRNGAGSTRLLRGLTTWMDKLSRESHARPSPVPRSSSKKRKPSSARGPLAALTGAERGSLVHHQVEDLVKLDFAAFRQLHRQGEHPWARDVLEAMVTGYAWRPVRAEFVVYSLRHNVATSLDLVMCDRKGRLMVVELKTGYSAGAFDRNGANRVWTPSWLREALPKTPFGDAVVQVIIGAELLRRRWKVPYSMLRLFVVRVDDDGVEFSRVSRALFRQLGPLLMKELSRKNLQKVRKR